ncbi:E3 ubiquitin-protein ligase RNF187 [Hippopotamus amphibius kiboko]|uniref:E3 ubiquitin-protein ligase RNF187 n=1 Tax=Hippopotamus amphibius kiboko TaxID=575201 RepID=UPI0025984AD0|nr:E3 ubiquitin-protein ligase RNF187 [Hippopotamus amphibius kiboko]
MDPVGVKGSTLAILCPRAPVSRTLARLQPLSPAALLRATLCVREAPSRRIPAPGRPGGALQSLSSAPSQPVAFGSRPRTLFARAASAGNRQEMETLSLLSIPIRAFPSSALRPRFSCVPVPGFPPCLRPRPPSHPCASVRVPVCALLEGPVAAALALPAGPAEAACALCQRAPREPVRADCGHRFCRACVVRFWAEEDGPFPCPECADDCWQRAVEPGRPPLSRRLLALEEAAAAPARDGPASEAALQLLCRADGGPLCAACRMAAGPEPPEWEPRWRKALRGKENKGSVEIMRKDLNDARDLHGQAESAAAVWKGHVMDRRKKALTDYKKLRAFFAEEEGRFLQEAEKEEGSLDDEDEDPAERFRSLLQAVSELERRHRNLGLSMLLQ